MLTLQQKIEAARGDNLNLIRLFLATAVIFSHSYSLLPGDKYEPLGRWTKDVSAGTLAVYSFFFISGFLIMASWQRSKTFIHFCSKRVLRIYPAYIAALVSCAALIWVICPEFKSFIVSSLGTGPWIKMVGHDALWLKSECISDLNAFADNPRPGLTNAPLWTIPIEFTCYLAVLAAGVSRLLRSRWLVLLATGLGYQFSALMQQQYNHATDQFYLCFACGAVAWLWRDRIPFSARLAAASLFTLLVTSHFRPWFSIAFPMAGGYCLLWLAYAPTLPFAKWSSRTDLSYGTYLYGCPIQQILVSYAGSYAILQLPAVNFVLAVPLTLGIAFISWTLIEKPCLSLKRRQVNQPHQAQPAFGPARAWASGPVACPGD